MESDCLLDVWTFRSQSDKNCETLRLPAFMPIFHLPLRQSRPLTVCSLLRTILLRSINPAFKKVCIEGTPHTHRPIETFHSFHMHCWFSGFPW